MSNSASRLLGVVQALNGGDAGKSALDQWIRILQVENSVLRDEEAVSAMSAAIGEVRLVEQHLSRLGAPPEVFAQASKFLRQAFAPTSAQGAWRDIGRQVFEGHATNPLQWAAWVIREFDQPDIDGPVLETLLRHIEAQQKLLDAGGLTFYIHEMLQKQIEELRSALRLYTVQGSDPLKKAYNTAVSEFMTVPEDVAKQATPSDAIAVTKGRDVLAEAGRAAKAGTEILNFLSTWSDTAANAIGYIMKQLPPPGGG